MRPVPIPDHLACPDGDLDLTQPGNLRRMVIAGPGGDLTGDIRPVEALVGVDPESGPIITVLVALEDDDLKRLTSMNQPAVWLSFHTRQLAPFSVEVADGDG